MKGDRAAEDEVEENGPGCGCGVIAARLKPLKTTTRTPSPTRAVNSRGRATGTGGAETNREASSTCSGSGRSLDNPRRAPRYRPAARAASCCAGAAESRSARSRASASRRAGQLDVCQRRSIGAAGCPWVRAPASRLAGRAVEKSSSVQRERHLSRRRAMLTARSLRGQRRPARPGNRAVRRRRTPWGRRLAEMRPFEALRSPASRRIRHRPRTAGPPPVGHRQRRVGRGQPAVDLAAFAVEQHRAGGIVDLPIAMERGRAGVEVPQLAAVPRPRLARQVGDRRRRRTRRGAASASRKWSISSGMSPRRSASGGSATSTTARRSSTRSARNRPAATAAGGRRWSRR